MTALGTIVAASPLNANDATRYLGFSTASDTDEIATFALGDTPVDFQTMNTLSWTYDGRESITGGDDRMEVLACIRNAAGTVVLAGASSTYASRHQQIYLKAAGGFSTTDVTRGPTAFTYVNTTATKTDWDGAIVEIRAIQVKNKAPDTVRPEPDYFAVSGDYTAGVPTASGGSTSTLTVDATGTGRKVASGGATSVLTVDATGAGQVVAAFTLEQAVASGYDSLAGPLDIPIANATAGNLLVASFFSRPATQPVLPKEASLYDTFSSDLSKWTDLSDGSSGYVIDTGQLLLTSVNGTEEARAQANIADLTDLEIVLLAIPGNADLVINVRSDGTYSAGSDVPNTSYMVNFQEFDNPQVVLYSVDLGGSGQQSIGSTTRANNNPHWIRFRVNGTSLQVRVWEDGTTEPTTWGINITNSVVTGPGSVEIGTWDNGATNRTVRADNVRIFDLNQTSEWTRGPSIEDVTNGDWLEMYYKVADGDEEMIRMYATLDGVSGDMYAGTVAEYSGFTGTPTLDQTATNGPVDATSVASGTTGTLADATSLALATFAGRTFSNLTATFTSYSNGFTEIGEHAEGDTTTRYSVNSLAALITSSTAATSTTATATDSGRLMGAIATFYDAGAVVSGGSTSTVTVEGQGSGVKEASGGATATVTVDATGTGEKIGSGGATSVITVEATGAGLAVVEGGSTSTVEVDATGSGTKLGQGGATSIIAVIAQGEGVEKSAGASTATVTVDATGSGSKLASGGATAVIEIDATGAGTADVPPLSGGSTSVIEVDGQGTGTKIASGGSTSLVTVDSQASGRKVGVGGADAVLEVDGQGSGTKIGQGGSDSVIVVVTEGEGTEKSFGGSTATVAVDGLGGTGTPLHTGGSDAVIEVDATGTGSKSVSGGSTATITVDATGAGSTGISGGSTSIIEVDGQGSGTKTVSGGSTSTITVDGQGSGIKEASGGSDAVLTVDATGSGTKLARGSSTSTITVDAQGAGVRADVIAGGSTSIIEVDGQGSGTKEALGGATSNITIDALGSGTKLSSGASTATVTVDGEGGGEVEPPAFSGGSTSTVTVSDLGSGSKGGIGGAEANITVDALGDGTKFSSGASESVLTVDGLAGGQRAGLVTDQRIGRDYGDRGRDYAARDRDYSDKSRDYR